jgi:hypothetical protein
MQEKKPGQGEPGKQWPQGDESGKQGGMGQPDIGKKGGSGDVGREGDKTGAGTEKKL